jgi:hypothetical protein
MSDSTLRQIYYNPEHPAAFGGVDALVRASGLSAGVVRDWLRGQSSYSLHKPARKRYSTRHYITSGINHQFQADLVDMQAYARDNDGYKHILTVIDMFSKIGWAEPIKSKTAVDMIAAFNKIFADAKPIKLQTDQGLEFESAVMQRFFHENDVEQFSVKSQFKAAEVERFNKTIKTKMWRFFTHNNTRRWLEVLPQLITGYNNHYHRAIKEAPNGINEDTEMELWLLNEPDKPTATHKVKVGDHVRISKAKNVFEKGYLPSWTEEVFTVSQLLNTDPPQVKVKDYHGEEIRGSFYMEEIQKVDKPEDYRIEKIVQTRRVGGRTEYLVKWVGYPDKFNEWVSENQMRRL